MALSEALHKYLREKGRRKTFHHSFKNLHGTNPQILSRWPEDTKAGYVLHCKSSENSYYLYEDTFQKVSVVPWSLPIALGDSKHRETYSGGDIASYSYGGYEI